MLWEIRATAGRYAVVGIPCFIKAIHLLRRIDPLIRERVTHTLGLFYGHMKSAAMVESFAWQLDTELRQVRALDYRIKDQNRPANWYRAHLDLQEGETAEQDWWHLADGDWGAGLFQNPACDWCDDVVAETADIAFGDAWVEPYSSDGRGTNVVVVRSRELKDMIERARAEGWLSLETVDAEFIVRTQAAGLRHRRDGLTLPANLASGQKDASQARAAFGRPAAAAQARLSAALHHRPAEPPNVPVCARLRHASPIHSLGPSDASPVPIGHLGPRPPRPRDRQATPRSRAVDGG